MSTTPRRLEIGPGDAPLSPDWETLDVSPGATYQANWGEESLHLPDNTFDEVYSSHALEHVPWHQTVFALQEVLRILKPGGQFEVWVPNFAYIVDCYRTRRCGDAWRRLNEKGDPMVWVNARIFTYGPEPNWHRATFDADFLAQRLVEAGFERIRITTTRTRGTPHGPIDLGAFAYAPRI